jgi:hypothetical protein
MPKIPALGRLRQEDLKLKASLRYILRSCLRTKIKTGIGMVSLSRSQLLRAQTTQNGMVSMTLAVIV